MGREIIGSNMTKTPQVKFTRENTPDAPAGSYIVGQKTGERIIDKYSTVFEFLLEDAHEKTPILLSAEKKDDNGKSVWHDAPVGPGSKVSIFGQMSKEGAKNQLMDKLEQVANGERVKITFNGKKPSKKGTRSYNDFTVEVL